MYGSLKSTTCSRSGVMDIEFMMTSTCLERSAGIRPSQAIPLSEHSACMRLHTSLIRSGSKPLHAPLLFLKENGG